MNSIHSKLQVNQTVIQFRSMDRTRINNWFNKNLFQEIQPIKQWLQTIENTQIGSRTDSVNYTDETIIQEKVE